MDSFYEITVEGNVIAECAWKDDKPQVVRTSHLAELLGFKLDFTEEAWIFDTREGLIAIKKPKDEYQFALWLAEWAHTQNRVGVAVGEFGVNVKNIDWDLYTPRPKPGYRI